MSTMDTHGQGRQAAEDQRGSLRIHCGAMLAYEVLQPEQVNAAAQEIRAQICTAPDDLAQIERLWHGEEDVWERVEAEFNRLGMQMAEINAKLDHLVALAEGADPGRGIRRFREIEDISGNGLSFANDEALAQGTVLRLEIELTRFPHLSIQCLASVARCEERADAPGGAKRAFSIGVCFDTINEEDREQIYRYIFRVQRRQLRSRKNEEDALGGKG